jgi:hypothetical protein
MQCKSADLAGSINPLAWVQPLLEAVHHSSLVALYVMWPSPRPSTKSRELLHSTPKKMGHVPRAGTAGFVGATMQPAACSKLTTFPRRHVAVQTLIPGKTHAVTAPGHSSVLLDPTGETPSNVLQYLPASPASGSPTHFPTFSWMRTLLRLSWMVTRHRWLEAELNGE